MGDVYDGLRLRTFGHKKAGTSTFSNPSLVSPTTPTLANPVRGFGLPTNNVIQTATEESTNLQEAQAANEQSLLSEAIHQQSFGHDISRISLRRPQAKLTVGAPNDVYEQEADRVADKVMSMPDAKPSVQREVMPEEEEEIQTKTLGDSIQCEVMPEEDEEIQTTRSADAGFPLESNLENRLSSSQGGGSLLPDEVRSFMEPRFDADFSQVRVHTGNAAVKMNQDLNAQAFTHKQDVYFGAGKAPAKDALTAHELTHVVQQTGAVQTKTASINTAIQRDDLKNPTITPAQQEPVVAEPGIMSKQDFLNRCGQVNTIIDAADRGTTAWLLSVAIAYGDAWKNHTDTLIAQDNLEKLQDELILGAALAFIPGGIGGMVGGALKNAKSSDFIIDGVKDLTKYVGRSPALSGLKGGGIVGSSGQGLKAFPTDPGQWQNQVALRIKSELLVATNNLELWQEIANSKVSIALNFDPVVAMNGALVVQGQKAAALQPVDQAQTSKDFEKGFWKTWLENYSYKYMEGPDNSAHLADKVGKKIRNRCESLGLDITPYKEESKRRVAERNQLFIIK
ncbi:DUF4157 domain-containing protein [Nostoc sp.]|uniref:eCIS core domain-containing protein n=1 Tax=Nostoc sp. TaxID=1180 RepID=UPI0035946EEB